MERLISAIESLAPLERLAVLHANNLAAAQTLLERVRPCLAPASFPPILTDVTAIVGTHAGPGAVGAAIVQAPA
jgi:fatty acid-binding protein DegV